MKQLVAMVLLSVMPALALGAGLPGEKYLENLNSSSYKPFKFQRNVKDGSFALSGGVSKQYPGKPEDSARRFLMDNHLLLGLSPELSELKYQKTSSNTRANFVEYQQFYKGVPVYASGALVNVSPQACIFRASGRIQKVPAVKTSPGMAASAIKDAARGKNPGAALTDDPPELIVYVAGGRATLAYGLRVTKEGKPGMLVVNADTGEELALDY